MLTKSEVNKLYKQLRKIEQSLYDLTGTIEKIREQVEVPLVAIERNKA